MFKIGFWQTLDFQNDKKYFFNSQRKNILGENPIETYLPIFKKII